MVRIGLYDRSFRRSTWARVEYGEPETDVDHILGHGPALAVELCSGREGDDAFVRVNRGDRKFNALLRVVEYSIGNLDGSDEKDAVAAAYREGMFDERERLAKLAMVKADPPFCPICEYGDPHIESCPFSEDYEEE